jgi:hypothetical protein
VVTPFGEPVRERAALPREGELWDRFGDVEFERRRDELKRPWNKEDGKRRLGVLEGMCEAVQMEVERMRGQLSLSLKAGEASEQMPQQQMTQMGATMPTEGQFQEPSDAQRDIAAQLQKLQGEDSPSASSSSPQTEKI